MKNQKTVDSTSGKENKPVSKKGCLSLKGKEKAKPEDRFSEITSNEVLAKDVFLPTLKRTLHGV